MNATRRMPGPLGLFIILGAAAFAADPVTLTTRLNRILDRSPLTERSLLGIHVVDLRSGKTLYARNETGLLLPASNMKLATSAAALTRLGADYRFTTRLVLEPSGDLALIGGGDPSLSFRTYPYDKDAKPLDPLHALEEMVTQAVRAGLDHVDGNIVGDDTLYPWDLYPPSWTHDDTLNEDGAPVSALTLNDNVVAITIVAGEQAGDPARIELNPSIDAFPIDNRVTTAAGAPRVRVKRRGNQFLLTGTLPVKGATAMYLPVDDPAQFGAQALYDILLRRGIAVRGRPVARHRYPGEDQAPISGQTLATRTSPPLSELLQVVNKVSQNLHAELVLRELGRVARGSGTREAGLAQVAAMLTRAGSPTEQFHLEDGSGLSRNAMLTPRLITRLLISMWQEPGRELWLSLLPIGGEDGTLTHRLCCTSEASRIHAKTGTLARAVALSGYADSKSHGMLAFSILVNNFASPSADVRSWVDKMALALVE